MTVRRPAPAAWRAWLCAALLALWLPGALAHASLLASEPAAGALLEAAPAELVLRFDEPVQALRATLLDDRGTPLALTPPRVDGAALRYELPRGALHGGTWMLSYRVASADAHPVSGTVVFSIGRASRETPPSTALPDDAATPALALALRIARNLALMLAAGSALFVLTVARFPGERAVLVAAGTAAVWLSIARIGVQGAELAAMGDALAPGAPQSVLSGLAAAFAPAAWHAALRSTVGAAALAGAAGAALIAAAALVRAGPARRWLLALGAGAAIGSLALTGHSAAATPRWFAGTVLVAHAAAAAFWFGALLALRLMLRQAEAAWPALQRFSSIALVAVPLLAAAGVALAALQMRVPGDLLQTRYGQLVALKAVLWVALLAVAAVNRGGLLPRRAEAALRRTIGVELALATLALAVTAGLAQTPPHLQLPLHARDPQGYAATLATGPGTGLHVELSDPRGAPLAAAEVEVLYANDAAGVEPLRLSLDRVAAGRWSIGRGAPVFAGTWRVEIRARVSDFERIEWRLVQQVR